MYTTWALLGSATIEKWVLPWRPTWMPKKPVLSTVPGRAIAVQLAPLSADRNTPDSRWPPTVSVAPAARAVICPPTFTWRLPSAWLVIELIVNDWFGLTPSEIRTVSPACSRVPAATRKLLAPAAIGCVVWSEMVPMTAA